MRSTSIAVVLCVLALHSATAQRNQNNRNNRKRPRQQRRQRNLQEYKNFADPIYPDNCIRNGTELLQNLREYYTNGRSDSLAGMDYGHPIQRWCVGPDLEAKLRKSKGQLRSQVSTAVQASTKDAYDAFDDVDANKLMDDWIAEASGEDCLELCGVMDGEYGDAFAEETQREQEEDDDDDDDNENNGNHQNYYSVGNTQEIEQEDRAEPMDSNIHIFTSNKNNDVSYPISNNQETETEGERQETTPEDYTMNSYYEEDEWAEWEEEAVPMDYSSSTRESNIAVARNKTTTAMLIRLIPIKLCALLAFMCLVLGIRQMILNSDRDHCCGRFGAILGFQTGGHVAYQGIDPSDVEESQKSVEFELLQLAASGDAFEDEDLDVDIGTDAFGDVSFSNHSDE